MKTAAQAAFVVRRQKPAISFAEKPPEAARLPGRQ